MRWQKTSALGKPDVDLFIARTDTRQTRLTTNQAASQSDSTQLKARNYLDIIRQIGMLLISQGFRKSDNNKKKNNNFRVQENYTKALF